MPKELHFIDKIRSIPEIQWLKNNRNTVIAILEGWGLSRILLTVIAWFSSYFAGNEIYQKYLDQGYFLSPKWLIDIWCRWDSKWYLSIVQFGYYAPEDISTQYSNLAFFPLYPYLIKALTFWLPESFQTESIYLLTGLIISNLCFILALFGIYELARNLFGDVSAKRTILLYFCLPAGFFFSTFYTESLFLFLVVFSVVYAEKKKWAAAGIFAMLAALTRPHGILILIPLGWLYLSKHEWKPAKIRPDCCWFLLAPLGIAAYFYGLYRLTGNYFAFFEAQGSWGRTLGTSFWGDYFEPLFNRFNRTATLDTVMISASLVLSLILLIRNQNKAYGIYALASTIVLIMTGNLFSMTRYTAAIFPIYILAGNLFSNKKLFVALCGLFAVIQVLLFSGWVNYYWIA